MRKKVSIALVALCSSFLLLNCNCGQRLCTNAIPVINFVNFDSASLHVVVLKAYSNDGKFDNLQHTQVYSNTIENGIDTIPFNNSNTIILDFFTDYTLEIPAINKTWHIKNITSHYDKLNASNCTGGMTYYLNDTIYTIAANPLNSNGPGYINISK